MTRILGHFMNSGSQTPNKKTKKFTHKDVQLLLDHNLLNRVSFNTHFFTTNPFKNGLFSWFRDSEDTNTVTTTTLETKTDGSGRKTPVTKQLKVECGLIPYRPKRAWWKPYIVSKTYVDRNKPQLRNQDYYVEKLQDEDGN